MPHLRHLLPTFCLAILSGSLSFAQESGLPGNATSLRETHGDWTVSCAIAASPEGNRTTRCSISQEQLDRQTRQRALAIELTPAGDGAEGVLILPFGLSLEAGITYQLDDGAAGAGQRFRTCLPAGCLVNAAFDARTVALLKAGSTLKVKALAAGGQELTFSISLAGFSRAFARVSALAK